MKKRTVSQLAEDNNFSNKKIFRIINRHLDKKLESIKINLKQIKNVVFDGSFIEGRKLSIVILLNSKNNKPFSFSFRVKENRYHELIAFLLKLKMCGLNPKSITIDGLKAVYSAFKKVWPKINVQRCLFHIQKQGLMWCRRYPKSLEAKKLKQIFKEVFLIKDYQTKEDFIKKVLLWEQKYGQKVLVNPSNGWVISDLKRARSMLLNALPDMFHFLNDSKIPKTSNCAESFFSKLKENLKIHRGLTKERRVSLIKHIIHFCQK